MPLAYAVSAQIVEPNRYVDNFVNEAWDYLLSAMEIEDTGFESLKEMTDLPPITEDEDDEN